MSISEPLIVNGISFLVVQDSCKIGSEHLATALEVLDGLGTHDTSVLLAREDSHEVLK